MLGCVAGAAVWLPIEVAEDHFEEAGANSARTVIIRGVFTFSAGQERGNAGAILPPPGGKTNAADVRKVTSMGANISNFSEVS
jgi:hypothetical protein